LATGGFRPKADSIVADYRSENNENCGSPADRLETFRLECISASLAPVRQFATKKVRAFSFFLTDALLTHRKMRFTGVFIQAK